MFSGGAVGADMLWEQLASQYGHKVRAFSFDKHHTNSENRFIIPQYILNGADRAIKKAAKSLKKSDKFFNTFVANLIRRNYYQITDTTAVYALAPIDFENQNVKGGTGWAVQMYIDECIDLNKKPNLYVCDIDGTWYNYSHTVFNKCDPPPIPTEDWTGIGSRVLTEAQIQAAKDLFNEK